MSNIHQNTLYLNTPGSYVSRDHLTLRVEVEKVVKLSVPIHHLESVCVFGPSTISPPALALCWEHGVAVNFLSEHGYFYARMTGVADTSVTLRRTQFRAADDPAKCRSIACQRSYIYFSRSRRNRSPSQDNADRDDSRGWIRSTQAKTV